MWWWWPWRKAHHRTDRIRSRPKAQMLSDLGMPTWLAPGTIWWSDWTVWQSCRSYWSVHTRGTSCLALPRLSSYPSDRIAPSSELTGIHSCLQKKRITGWAVRMSRRNFWGKTYHLGKMKESLSWWATVVDCFPWLGRFTWLWRMSWARILCARL